MDYRAMKKGVKNTSLRPGRNAFLSGAAHQGPRLLPKLLLVGRQAYLPRRQHLGTRFEGLNKEGFSFILSIRRSDDKETTDVERTLPRR